ncbi:MAG: hypothetical protein JHC71_13040, partial [Blastococcus sp.]|nr:hypothetical protein [Blastococcus sp.]
MSTKRRTVDVIMDAIDTFTAEEIQKRPELAEQIIRWRGEESLSWVAMLPPRFGETSTGRRDTRAMRYRFCLRDPEP